MPIEADLHIIDRSAWGARAPSRPIADMHYPVGVVYVHHEAGGQFLSLYGAVEAARMRGVQDYTMDTRHYADIPYSIGCFPSGRMYEGRDLVDEDAATRHAGTSLSMFCPGNYDLQAPTDAMLAGMALTIRLAITFGKLAARPQILGHRDNNPTGCPGNLLYAALPRLRMLVAATTVPVPAPPPVHVPAPPVTYDFSEDTMRSTLLEIGPLDDKGRGWGQWDPALGHDPVYMHTSLHGSNPPTDGYWYEDSLPITGAQARGGLVIVEVVHGKPGGTVGVLVSAA